MASIAATSAGNRASAPKALRLLELKVAGIRATGPRNAEAKELLKTFAYAQQTANVTGKTLASICQEFGMI